MDSKSPQILAAAGWISSFLTEDRERSSFGMTVISMILKRKTHQFTNALASYIAFDKFPICSDSASVAKAMDAVGLRGTDQIFLPRFTVDVSNHSVVANGFQVYPLWMLDLKYRPTRFSEVVGNAGVVKALLARSRGGSLHGRSMMFGGPKGCGKTSLARISARAASCSDIRDGEPCNECAVCLSLLNESSSSFEEFDAASHGSVDRIRSMVDDLEYGTVDGLKPVLILDEAHRLGPAAQDAMLKAMEERRMTVILCTTEPGKIRPAVRDRVEEYPIRPPSEDQALAWLSSICKSESIAVEDGVLLEVVKSNGCSPRSCLNSVWTMSVSGGVTIAAVRDLFRYLQIETIARVLRDVTKDPVLSFSELDSVMASESPAWIRDTIVKLISSAARASVGSPPRHGYPTWFYESRNPSEWSSIARFLSSVDRPSASDIELAIISDNFFTPRPDLPREVSPILPAQVPVPSIQAPVVQPPVQAPVVQTPIQPPQAVVKEIAQVPTALKSIELDGVTFRSDEKLTTLDDKMEPSRGVSAPDESVEVEFDNSRIPMSEQEFSRAFLERFS